MEIPENNVSHIIPTAIPPLKAAFFSIALDALTNEEYIFSKVILFQNKYSLFSLTKEKEEKLGWKASVSMKVTYDKYGPLPDTATFTIYCIESDCLDTKFTELCNCSQVTWDLTRPCQLRRTEFAKENDVSCFVVSNDINKWMVSIEFILVL